MTTAAIYARVSSDEQVAKGTIENQLYACRTYCEQAGYEVIEEFRDDGVSGTIPLIDRPSGARLIAATDSQSVDVVITYHVDRLSRDLEVGLVAIRYLEAKVKIEFVDGNYDDSDIGIFSKHVQMAVSQLDRRRITRKLHDGLKKTVREGGYVSSLTPFGYIRVDGGKQLEPHPEEAPIVEQIFRLASEGMSSYAIARYLDAEGVPEPKSTTKAEARNHRGWLHRTVRGFLQNPRYCGEATYGPDKMPMACPPLVSKELFKSVGASLPVKKSTSRRNTRHDYLLQNLLFCAVCGKRYYADTTHGKRIYCCSVVRSNAQAAGHGDIRTRYDADYLEAAVLDWICRTMWPLDPDQSFSGFSFEVAEDSASGVSEAAIARLDGVLADLVDQRERTLSALARGVISDSDVSIALAGISAKKEQTELALTRERKTLADSVDVAKTASSWLAWIKAHADPDRKVSWTEDEFLESGFEVQRAVAKLMIDRITVEDDKGRGLLRIEGRASGQVPLFMDVEMLPNLQFHDNGYVSWGEENQETPSAGVTVGSRRTPRSRTQPIKR